MTNAIELSGIVVRLQGHECLSDVTLTVAIGECVVLLGPNRSGKSLILELCAGLVEPVRGTVRVLGWDWSQVEPEDERDLRVRMGTVLQPPGLLSNLTLFDNVALPLRYHRPGLSVGEIERLVTDQLGPLGLTALRDRFPAQLGPGEARCAAIARALVLKPELVLVDDPVDGLDADMVGRLGAHVEATRRSRPMALMLTLRAPSPLLDCADRVVEVRAGRIHAVRIGRDADGSATELTVSPQRRHPGAIPQQNPPRGVE